jgi:hypothetical protein
MPQTSWRAVVLALQQGALATGGCTLRTQHGIPHLRIDTTRFLLPTTHTVSAAPEGNEARIRETSTSSFVTMASRRFTRFKVIVRQPFGVASLLREVS